MIGDQRLFSWRQSIPVQTNARNLYSFYVDQQRNAVQTLAHSVVKDRYDAEQDRQQSGGNPTTLLAAEVTKRQRQQHARDEDDSSGIPVLAADLVEKLGAAL